MHAHDTLLRRDVAIKCIKITQRDVAKARISIHDAQVGGAGAAQRRATAARSSNPDMLIPADTKISEPTFLDSREKQAERRANRRQLIRTSARPGVDALQFDGGYNDRHSEAFSRRRKRDLPEIESFDFSEFSSYSNYKGRAALEQFSQTVNPITPSSQKNMHRRMPSAQEISSNTIGLAEFAAGLPGMIKGAGHADINGIGDSINFPKTRSFSEFSEDFQSYSDGFSEGYYEGVSKGKSEGFSNRFSDDFSGRSINTASDQSDSRNTNLKPSIPIVMDSPDPLASSDGIPGLEEARTAAHLNDANIVTVYDCVVEGDTAYVIMEYVEGKTLARIMRDLGNDITLDMIATIFKSIAHALEVAHKANVLHLDIKPENVIINREGVVKVTDFGLSTLMDVTGHGQTGGGTIGYMPLEQMRQQRLDVRTDEWALASLTYEMLSGKNPFKARNLRDAEDAIEGAELVIPSLCWENIDKSVDDIMFDALSPEMENRYPSISEFSADLAPLLGDAHDGERQLALAVNDAGLLFDEPKEQQEREVRPNVPFIDKLGVGGSNILMRVFSALGIAMIVAIAMLNFRVGIIEERLAIDALQYSSYAHFGLFGTFTIAACIILVVFIVLGALLPKFAMPLAYIALSVMLFYNQAWALGAILLVSVGAWWWLVGRQSDMMCTLVVLQPLFGSVGFSAVVPVISGALLDIRDAVLVSLMVAISAITFASLGTADIGNWDVVKDFIVAVNPQIAGTSMTESFMKTVTSEQNWCMIGGWILASFVYSLFCRRGTHAFDVIGSLFCAAIIVGTTIVFPLCSADFALLTPLAIAGIAVAALVGIALSLLNVTDRVRMAPGEW